MVLVKTIYTWDAEFLHGYLLDVSDDLLPLLRSLAHYRRVEHRTHLVLAYGILDLLRIKHETFRTPVSENVDSDLCHLADLLFQSHARKSLLDRLFNFRICRNRRFHGIAAT